MTKQPNDGIGKAARTPRNLSRADLSRRNFFATASAAAAGGLALAQGAARAAIVRADFANLPPYGNSTLPPGIRSRTVSNVNGLTVHILEGAFETQGGPD